MSFTNPGFLFALGLLAVPVIIHLFNFRKYRRVKFTNVSLLEEVKEKTHSASRLKNLLILLCRLLAVAALVIAFAEPFTGKNDELAAQAETIGIYVDNSPSMAASGKDGKLLLTAIERAQLVINAFPANTSFILSTNTPDVKLQRQLTKSEALDEVGLIRESYSVKKLSAVVKKQQAIASGKSISTFLISDFQKTTADFGNFVSDSTVSATLVPVSPADLDNLSIDSAWFNSPAHLVNGTEELSFTVKNYGDDEVESLTAELFINGKPAALSNVSVPAGGVQTVTLNYVNRASGTADGEIRINDAPISFDNSYFFSYMVSSRLNVFEVSGDNASGAVKNLFAGDEDYEFRTFTEKSVDYSQLKARGALILNGVSDIPTGLKNLVIEKLKNGEAVAIFPGEKINLNSYNDLLGAVGARLLAGKDTTRQRVASMENRHPFFNNLFEKIPQNLDLPLVLSSYTTVPGISRSQSLMRLQNGNDFLSQTGSGSGNFYLSTVPLAVSSSSFTQHGLFVPVMLRIAESSGYVREISYKIGSDAPIRLNGTELPEENVLKIRNANTEMIPLVRKVNEALLVYPSGDQLRPGIYTIAAKDNTPLSNIGFNLSRLESDPSFFTARELKTQEKPSNGRIKVLSSSPSKIASAIRENYEGKKLWKLFVLLTLIFITAEILLSKWLR